MFSLKVREREGRGIVCCVCVWGGLALPPHFLCEITIKKNVRQNVSVHLC